MTVPLADLADILSIERVRWGVHRNDELSGTGDARTWQTEHADPLWTGEVFLTLGRHHELKRVAAKIRKLHGAQETFLLFDPLSKYPHADPDGSILGASNVEVHSIGSDNQSLRLKGLPNGYALTAGDKGQIVWSGQNFFFEFSEDTTADGSGVTPMVGIFPHIPPGIEADDAVTLAKPACRVFIVPGSHDPGEARNVITSGASFTVMERRR